MIYNLHHIIEKAASKSPDSEAFRCLTDTVTFGELDAKSNQLATYLIQDGVKKGDRIGIFMNRCLETAIAVYGILKAGGAYVPLDPFVPTSRTIRIVGDCQISHIITTPEQNRRIEKIMAHGTSVRGLIGCDLSLTLKTVSWPAVYSLPKTLGQNVNVLANDLALILYTSGSTGVPKGIMHTHSSVLSLAQIMAHTFDLGPDDIIGNPAPLHFDPSTFGFFVAPLVGAKTIIIPDAYLKLPASLAAMMADEKITVWYSVPLMLIQLLKSNSLQQHDFGALRQVFFAGEVFITKHLRALMEQWPHIRFTNLYGPAELILCTFYPVTRLPAPNDNIPIGTVWANTEYMVLDSRQREVPRGHEGELAVRSATLMAGYWNNEPLTTRAFHKIKIAEGYEHIYYRTGDLVKENENGELLFLGRKDRQIKLRGYRIELDEIEQTLLREKHVEEAAVVVINKEKEAQELAAAVKLRNAEGIDAAHLREFCKVHLPLYAVPAIIELFDDLPRTSSGKINRKEINALLDPDPR
ncbi:amino acid adenylation domain-containing protein [Pseudozobellia thermophila]|uniref:Amino acid adenylation domain-containing protein n=1 Tax=Pseudozobellia thermophila TaxID=192903 RepID=A0A1M6ITK0_9FLAO|nr:amino acid adenylation domain-containing protein [Pseudozobellia thermophila]SHJ37766.1 amino acid adenylation domain-containing protein [Pseudozobellia thermophila]